MTLARPQFEHLVLGALEASPSRIPVLVGGCGTGRTHLLRAAGRGHAEDGVPGRP